MGREDVSVVLPAACYLFDLLLFLITNSYLEQVVGVKVKVPLGMPSIRNRVPGLCPGSSFSGPASCSCARWEAAEDAPTTRDTVTTPAGAQGCVPSS